MGRRVVSGKRTHPLLIEEPKNVSPVPITGIEYSCQHNQGPDSPIETSNDQVSEVLGHDCSEELFHNEWKNQSSCKWPTKHSAYSEPEDALGSLDAASSVQKRSCAQHCRVHGKARGQISCSSMKHARTCSGNDHEEDGNARADGSSEDIK
jgi:hypothetical protein